MYMKCVTRVHEGVVGPSDRGPGSSRASWFPLQNKQTNHEEDINSSIEKKTNYMNTHTKET